MVKPDGVQRGKVGAIISRFEDKGFKITGLKMYQTSKEVAEEHYKDLSEKPFFGKLVDYIISGPVVCIVRTCPALPLPICSMICCVCSILANEDCPQQSEVVAL